MINREWMRRFGPPLGWILGVRSVYMATQSSNVASRIFSIVCAVMIVGGLLFDLWERRHPRPRRRKSREREAVGQACDQPDLDTPGFDLGQDSRA